MSRSEASTASGRPSASAFSNGTPLSTARSVAVLRKFLPTAFLRSASPLSGAERGRQRGYHTVIVDVGNHLAQPLLKSRDHPKFGEDLMPQQRARVVAV